MQNTFYALALTIFPAAGIFLLLKAMGADTQQASPIAALIIGLYPKILEAIEKRTTRPKSDDPAEDIASFAQYQVSVNRATVYATAMGLATLIFWIAMSVALSGLLMGVMANAAKLEIDAFKAAHETTGGVAMILGTALSAPFLFFIGRWVGRRCASHGIVVTIAAPFFIVLLTMIFSLTQLSPDQSDTSISRSLLETVILTFVLFLLMLPGFVLGKRQRLSNYLAYLLKQLNRTSQLAVVDLAYKETLGQTRGFMKPSAPHSAHVVGTAGLHKGNRFPVQTDLVFGRDPKTCNVVFNGKQDGISSRHCTLRFDPAAKAFELRDLGSLNGTFVNGTRIRPSESKRLRDGDEFQLHSADCRFVVHAGDT